MNAAAAYTLYCACFAWNGAVPTACARRSVPFCFASSPGTSIPPRSLPAIRRTAVGAPILFWWCATFAGWVLLLYLLRRMCSIDRRRRRCRVLRHRITARFRHAYRRFTPGTVLSRLRRTPALPPHAFERAALWILCSAALPSTFAAATLALDGFAAHLPTGCFTVWVRYTCSGRCRACLRSYAYHVYHLPTALLVRWVLSFA